MKTKDKIEWFLSRTRFNLKQIGFKWTITQNKTVGKHSLTRSGTDKDTKITVIVEVKNEAH